MKFSLIIPCYNEEDNLPLLVEKCATLREIDDLEVLLVDNGSTDNTEATLLNLINNFNHIRMIKVSKNLGYGHGILAGLDAARGEILGWTHADLQTDPNDFKKAIEIVEKEGSDAFVKGKRFGRPFVDKVFTLGMSIFESLLLRKKLTDINAQPTVFSRDFYKTWKNAPYDFSLDLFVYYNAQIKNLRIFRIPVYFGVRAHGVSHWNVNLKAKINFIKRTINYSLKLKKSVKNWK